MKIFEVANGGLNNQKIMALSQFLLSRAEGTDAKKTFELSSFLSLADNMGISMTGQQFKDLSLLPPLSNIITNVEIDPANPDQGTVYFQGAEDPAAAAGSDTMSVDQARDTVNKMAKRANKI
jgi:hypothetical protein